MGFPYIIIFGVKTLIRRRRPYSLQDAIFQRARLGLIAIIDANLLVEADRVELAGCVQAERNEGLNLVDVYSRRRASADTAADLTGKARADGTAHFGGAFGGWRADSLARPGCLADIADAVFETFA